MKTIKLSLLAIFFIAFSSCSKDDDNSSDLNSSMIVGVWNLSSLNYEGVTEVNFDGTNITSSFTGIGEDIDATLTFNADNTFKNQGSYKVNLTTEGFSQTVPIDDFSTSGDWSINGNILNTSTNLAQISNGGFTPAETTSEVTIQEMTENRIVLIFEQISKFDASGFENISTISGEYVLTR